MDLKAIGFCPPGSDAFAVHVALHACFAPCSRFGVFDLRLGACLGAGFSALRAKLLNLASAFLAQAWRARFLALLQFALGFVFAGAALPP
jgi:hypothetical protein